MQNADTERHEVITSFQTPITKANKKTNPVVMLISLKSGAVGLNLTAASNVFLVRSRSEETDASVTRGGSRQSKHKQWTVCIE